uniref:Uncharacterized protein n=1 Tax=Pyropia endiviifolia TaxID=1699272 RepID=A0A1S5QMV2_9RHOD|nr:hypothetical protein [Pyropia endiviifolia]
MRSRILYFKMRMKFYDFLTQFTVKKPHGIPTLFSSEIKIQNLQPNDIKQVCLNLVSIQLVGNNYTLCKNQKDVFRVPCCSKDNHVYFGLENLALLIYKNKLEKISLSQNEWHMYGKNFLSLIEHFTLDLKFLKLLENTSNKHLKITFSCQISNSKASCTTAYFLKSLGFPC